MTRLDIFIAKENSISRETAQKLINGKKVLVDSRIITKPSFKVSNESTITITEHMRYVSRGGYKLEKAINVFDIDLSGAVCMDVGASTGGFTDCMLQNSASKVYAIDVGHSQISEQLLKNPNVISMEKTNIKDAKIPEKVDFASIDVSFVSLTKILDCVYDLVKDEGQLVCLVKPQFEAGKRYLNKKGIVKDPKIHTKVLNNIIDCVTQIDFFVKGVTFSSITGMDGNIEYLLYMSKLAPNMQCDVHEIVRLAFENHRTCIHE